MNTYVNAHLQQRKSSTYNKTKTLQDNIKFKEVLKQPYTQHLNHRQIPSFQQTHKKQIQKPKYQNTQESSQTSRKTQNRLRDEQSSDYIRNLYKKYLGKQNKQPHQKIAVCTERKLKTTQSKQLLTSNTNFKDFTRRTLFNNNEQQNSVLPNTSQSNQAGMKKQKTKVSTLLSKQDQENQTKQPKRTLSNIKIPKSSTDLKQTVQNNRQSLNKQQQKKKDFQSRKSTAKNYKSKPKVQKQKQLPRQDQIKNNVLKRSNSAQIRNQKPEKDQPKKSSKQRTITEQQSQLKKTHNRQQQSIHPHRSSYCQFDTQQQLTNQQSSCTKRLFQNAGSRTKIESKQGKQALFYEQIKQHQNLHKTKQSNAKSIYFTYVNNLDQLQTLVGENNSIYQALKRINIIKSKANLTAKRSSAFYN